MAVNERGFSLVETLIVTVIMLLAMGVATSIFVQGNNTYAAQRDFDDARSNAAAALDMTVRLLRNAQTIVPDPDANLVADSIRVVSDWNPKDGDTLDAYEDVTFTVVNGTLFKQEPGDVAPIAFAERIAAITFTYFDQLGAPVTNPWTAPASRLALVAVRVQCVPINGVQIVVNSSASVRRRE